MGLNRKEGYIPRKAYLTISPGYIRSLLTRKGVEDKLVGPITEALSTLFTKFSTDERLNYDCIEASIVQAAGTLYRLLNQSISDSTFTYAVLDVGPSVLGDATDVDKNIILDKTNGWIEIVVPGIYHIGAQVSFTNNATGRRQGQIDVLRPSGNIWTVANTHQLADNSATQFMNFSGVMNCVQGDLLKLGVFQNSGGALNLRGASRTFLYAYRIGSS